MVPEYRMFATPRNGFFATVFFALVLDGGFDGRVCKDMWITRFTAAHTVSTVLTVTPVYLDKENDVLVTIRNEVAGMGNGDRGQTALAAGPD